MNERIQIKEFRSVGYLPDKEGKVVERDIMLRIDGEVFILGVATRGRKARVIRNNENLPQEQQIDDLLLEIPGLDDLTDLDKVIGLISDMSLADVKPFLVKQTDDDEEGQ